MARNLDRQLVGAERLLHPLEAALLGEILDPLAVLGEVGRVEAVLPPVAAERDERPGRFGRGRPEERLVALLDQALEVGIDVDVDHVAERRGADELPSERFARGAPHAFAGDGVLRPDGQRLAGAAVHDRRAHLVDILLDAGLLVVEEDGRAGRRLGVSFQDRLEHDLR